MIRLIESKFMRQPTENEQQYIWRLGQAKDAGTLDLSWNEIAELVNDEFHSDARFQESAFRKPYQTALLFYNQVFAKLKNDADYEKSIQSQRDDLYMMKKQYSDQRREYLKLLDVEARWQNLSDKLVEAVETISKKKPLFTEKPFLNFGDRESVLVLNDFHYGMVTDNIFNTYNTEICRQRVKRVVSKTIQACETHSVRKMHILLLGDAAQGCIHTTCRVASEEETADQIMHVSEIIAEAINEIADHVESVDVHSTYGNHLRSVQNKKDSIHSDNMERIIPWWLRQRLINRSDVRIIDSEYYEFIKLSVFNFNVCAAHGDLDHIKNFGVTVNTIFTQIYGETINYAILADKHHTEEFEPFGIESILCRSLCGVDEYANNNRLYSKPGQTLMIFNREEGRECTYNIKV